MRMTIGLTAIWLAFASLAVAGYGTSDEQPKSLAHVEKPKTRPCVEKRAEYLIANASAQDLSKAAFESRVKEFIDGAQKLYKTTVPKKGDYETSAQYKERRALAAQERDRRLQAYFSRYTNSLTVTVPVKKVSYKPDKQTVWVEAEPISVTGAMAYPAGGGSGCTVPRILCFVVIPSKHAKVYVSGSTLNMRLTHAPLSVASARDHDVVRNRGTFEMTFQLGYDRCQYRDGLSHRDYLYFPALRLTKCAWKIKGEPLWRWSGSCDLCTPEDRYPPAAW